MNAIEKRVEIKIGAPRRVIIDELACPLDRLVGRAPRPVAEAVGMEMRVEDRREHLQQAWQINRSTAAGAPTSADHPRAWGSSPS